MRMARIVFLMVIFLSSVIYASEPQVTSMPQLSNEATVVIRGVDKDVKGPLLVYLYADDDTWLKAEKSVQKTVIKTKGKTEYRWTLKQLPAGEYAVQVIHDEDSNGDLTMGFFGPSEGVGVSKYVPSFIPSFDKAKFKHNGQSSLVSVEMSY